MEYELVELNVIKTTQIQVQQQELAHLQKIRKENNVKIEHLLQQKREATAIIFQQGADIEKLKKESIELDELETLVDEQLKKQKNSWSESVKAERSTIALQNKDIEHLQKAVAQNQNKVVYFSALKDDIQKSIDLKYKAVEEKTKLMSPARISNNEASKRRCAELRETDNLLEKNHDHIEDVNESSSFNKFCSFVFCCCK